MKDQGEVVDWFSGVMGENERRRFALADEEQIITELEALGVLAAINQRKRFSAKSTWFVS